MKITNRVTGVTLFASDHATMRGTLEAAVKARANLAGAYLVGADITGANLAGGNLACVNLAGGNLTGADLARTNLTCTNLTYSNLTDACLTGANLVGAYLTGADISGADITEVHLSPKERYAQRARARERNPHVPVIDALDAKILSAISNGGKLDMSTWHRCGTTHCRAGWAIRLAGEAGLELEGLCGPALAGSLIYRVSTGRVPDFYASTEAALADLKDHAALEQTT